MHCGFFKDSDVDVQQDRARKRIVEHIAPVLDDETQSVVVDEYVARVSAATAVDHAVLAHVIEHFPSAPAVTNAAPAPMDGCVTPASFRPRSVWWKR